MQHLDRPDVYLPVIRQRALQLRPAQEGTAWTELRGTVARLLIRLISDHGIEHRMVDERAGIGGAICVPISDREAALRTDGAVFWIASPTPWTALRAAGTWLAPHDPAIVMLYTELPPDVALH
jgi:hypothetical protein